MMTIEEKAKAYDEALERAKNFIENGDKYEKTVAESIFAGLSESEDERIRKEMIEILRKEAQEFPSSVIAEKSNSWIAWLKKDSYTKQQLRDMGFAFTINGDIVTPEKSNEAIKEYIANEKKKWEKEQKPAEWSEEDWKIKGAIVDYLKDCDLMEWATWLENRKSVVVPKFRVGDTIRIKNSNAEYHITDISDGKYRGKGWSLDIVTCDESDDYEIVEWGEEDEKIRKALIEYFQVDGCLCGNIPTKDVRAWLEKQGEQKPIKWNADDLLKRNQIMDILQEYNRTELITWFEKQGEQKPAEWSEDDEKWAEEIRLALKFYSDDIPFVDKLTTWFNNHIRPQLKFRVGDLIKKKDSDVVTTIESIGDKNYYVSKCQAFFPIADQDKYELVEPKLADWTDEDDAMRNFLIKILEVEHPNGLFSTGTSFVEAFKCSSIPVSRIIDWLKNLY